MKELTRSWRKTSELRMKEAIFGLNRSFCWKELLKIVSWPENKLRLFLREIEWIEIMKPADNISRIFYSARISKNLLYVKCSDTTYSIKLFAR